MAFDHGDTAKLEKTDVDRYSQEKKLQNDSGHLASRTVCVTKVCDSGPCVPLNSQKSMNWTHFFLSSLLWPAAELDDE